MDQPGERGERGDPLARAGRLLLIVLGVEVAVLVVTGVALYSFYPLRRRRPGTTWPWPTLLGRSGCRTASGSSTA